MQKMVLDRVSARHLAYCCISTLVVPLLSRRLLLRSSHPINLIAGRLLLRIMQDVDAEMTAEDEGIDGAGASAEEAAVHTIDEDQV